MHLVSINALVTMTIFLNEYNVAVKLNDTGRKS